MQEDTLKLIEKAKKGDSQAFGQLIESHEKMVFNIVYRMMKDDEDRKDMSQEVFIKAYRNLDKFDGKSSFSTWIYRIAVNTCIDEMRKRKGKDTYSIDETQRTEDSTMERQFSDPSPTPEARLLKKERAEKIQQCINLLSLEHKTMIVLRDIEGFSYQEIAAFTGINEGTVKSRIARARLQLKNILQKELFMGNSRQTGKKGGKENGL